MNLLKASKTLEEYEKYGKYHTRENEQELIEKYISNMFYNKPILYVSFRELLKQIKGKKDEQIY